MNQDLSNYTTTFRASQPRRIKRNRQTVSCCSCRLRKLKCDRQQPCGACRKRGEENACRFGPAPKRASSSAGKDEIRKELRHMRLALEALAEKSGTGRDVSHSQLAESINRMQRALDADEATVSAEPASAQSEVDVVFGSLSPTTLLEIHRALPSRQAMDSMIAAYFNARYLTAPFIHAHQFKRQYELFWNSPESVHFLWVSILFSVLAIGAVVTNAKGTSPIPVDPLTYLSMSARCLLAGQYLEAEELSIEALAMYSHSRFTIRGSQDVALHSLCGMTVRLAQLRGYHRVPSDPSLALTPFQAEMRRRVWFTIQLYDVLCAFGRGLPSLIHEDNCHTGHPTNVTDDDFDEDSTFLSPRPLTDPQSMAACVYQSMLLPILRRIIRHALGLKACTYPDAILLGHELETWYLSIPPYLRARSIRSTSFTDQSHTVMDRIMLELLYSMGNSILYRPFLDLTKPRDQLSQVSLGICRRMAMRGVRAYIEVDRELQRGGRLHEDRYIAINLSSSDFMVWKILAPLEFADCPDMPIQESSNVKDLLETACQMWSARAATSMHASEASRVLRVISGQIQIAQHLVIEIPYDTSNFYRAEDMGNQEEQTQPLSHYEQNEGEPSEALALSEAFPEITRSLIVPAFNEPLVLEKSSTPTVTAPGTALVRILSTSVRPHNRNGFAGKGFLSFTLPFAPGDTAVARVLSVGDGAVAVKPGQLVFINGFVAARDDPDGTRVLIGLHDGGGKARDVEIFELYKGLWRDTATMPIENCLVLNEAILRDQMGYSYADLNYIQRLAVAYGGISAAGLRTGETVIVAPATGHFSGAVAEIAAQIGCRVIALSRSASKLEPLTSRYPRITALELTGETEKDIAAIRKLCPEGADTFIDVSPPQATASPHHLSVSLDSLRPFGRAVFLGAMLGVSVNYMGIMTRNITIKGQFMYTRRELVSLIKLIEAGVLKLGKDAGHETVGGGFALEDWEEALVVAEGATAWGQQVVFTP
ncbi:uncharacterized protein NECHADRAFT_54141 [Fusarium vanettenii 77-13-4]|uniref:Zn(2)-C6 fungal-type domain-containing protein n=1 Tax=Fusarium vanettenii (strain ATCC MYA-4622 / CBS 123669 / FGSC 9596 / NRRL 45880 / 77-13-4) TaxID=660122 RepID=C7Z2E8_FUSV7|nr:uncharacterized protein NECHADRAFT_54141 [Fusarium vanettenii 77-13-4]EEU41649.1 hypothetical protein NECHADRAFT_54141 [Fusarium vanettenii 77-13-4]